MQLSQVWKLDGLTSWANVRVANATGLQCHGSKKMLSHFSESAAQTKPVWGAFSKDPRRNGIVLPYVVSQCEDLTVRYKTQNHSASGVVGGESLVFLVSMRTYLSLAPVYKLGVVVGTHNSTAGAHWVGSLAEWTCSGALRGPILKTKMEGLQDGSG